MGSILNVSDQKTLQIPVSTVLGTVATWTLAYAGDLLTYTCDTTDELAKVVFPIPIAMNNSTLGAGSTNAVIEKVEIAYTVGTAALDAAPVAEIQSVARAVDGAAPVVTTKACTVAAAGTITNTKTVDDHLVTITPNAALATAGTASLIGEISFDKAATSTVAITSVVVYFRDFIG
jgi:hypothetical protein